MANLELWQKAAKAYQGGDYLKSAELYQQIAAEDPSEWTALYNSGNSYYKAGHMPEAIDCYWKAYQKNPRSLSLNRNLNTALTKVGESLVPRGMPSAIYRLGSFFVYEEWVVMAMIFWLVLGIASWLYFFRKKSSAIRKTISASGILLLVSLLGTAFARLNYKTQWMVLQSPGLLRSGPSDTLPVTTQIPEGRIVKVLKKQDDWLFIETRKESLRGWMK